MECSISRCVARSFFAMGGTSLFSCPIGLQYSLASRRQAIFALCRVLSSDHRKGYFGGNGPSNRHTRQSVFLESSVHDRKHLRLRQTHNRLKETQEKLKLTQQRMKESKRRIMEDIRDTKSLMKERMENIIERENIWTVPNVLCVTRIVFSPYIGYLVIQSDFSFALGLLAVAGVTDALDGWIARTWKHQSSKLGSFLDPMADKVLIATLFLSLTYVELIPMALTALIILRDVTLVGAGFFIRYQSLPPPRTFHRYFDATHATAQLAPTTISKVNTMIQLLLVASTLGAPVFDYVDHPLLLSLCVLTAGTTVASALSYIFSKDTYKILKRKNK